MTTFAQHCTAFESFLDCVQGGAGKDAITGCLAENVVLDADGKIAEVTIWWRPLPPAAEMQGRLAHVLGMQPWELRTNGE